MADDGIERLRRWREEDRGVPRAVGRLGAILTSVAPRTTTVRTELTPELLLPGGSPTGAVSALFADIGLTTSVIASLPDLGGVTTISMTVDHLCVPPVTGALSSHCTADAYDGGRPQHAAGTLHDDTGRLVATASGWFLAVPAEDRSVGQVGLATEPPAQHLLELLQVPGGPIFDLLARDALSNAIGTLYGGIAALAGQLAARRPCAPARPPDLHVHLFARDPSGQQRPGHRLRRPAGAAYSGGVLDPHRTRRPHAGQLDAGRGSFVSHGPEHWDARYADAARPWLSEPSGTVTSALAGVAPGRALDVATGTGRHAVWLAASGWQVTAVDFSAVGVAQGRARSDQVEWVVADVLTWSPGGAYDLVLAAYVQLGVAGLQRLAGRLAPGGRLVVVGHALRNLTDGVHGPRDPALLHTEQGLRDGAEGLTVERLEEVLRPDAGGTSIDLVLIARA